MRHRSKDSIFNQLELKDTQRQSLQIIEGNNKQLFKEAASLQMTSSFECQGKVLEQVQKRQVTQCQFTTTNIMGNYKSRPQSSCSEELRKKINEFHQVLRKKIEHDLHLPLPNQMR